MLDSAFSRPAVLITDGGNAPAVAPDNRVQRDGELVDALMATLRSNGAPPSRLLHSCLSCNMRCLETATLKFGCTYCFPSYPFFWDLL